MSDNEPDNVDDPWLDKLYQDHNDASPPPELDAAVLAVAAKKTTAPARSSAPSKWPVSLATAAVLVLTVGVFFNQTEVGVESAPEVELFMLHDEVSAADADMAPTAPSADEYLPERQSSAGMEVSEIAVQEEREIAQPASESLESVVVTAKHRAVDPRPNAPEPTSALSLPANAKPKREQEQELDQLLQTVSGLQSRYPEAALAAENVGHDADLAKTISANTVHADPDRLENPNCAEAYQLPEDASDIVNRNGWTMFRTAKAQFEVRCASGKWQVEQRQLPQRHD